MPANTAIAYLPKGMAHLGLSPMIAARVPARRGYLYEMVMPLLEEPSAGNPNDTRVKIRDILTQGSEPFYVRPGEYTFGMFPEGVFSVTGILRGKKGQLPDHLELTKNDLDALLSEAGSKTSLAQLTEKMAEVPFHAFKNGNIAYVEAGNEGRTYELTHLEGLLSPKTVEAWVKFLKQDMPADHFWPLDFNRNHMLNPHLYVN